jgi:outer membrane protein assembly factor BamB
MIFRGTHVTGVCLGLLLLAALCGCAEPPQPALTPTPIAVRLPTAAPSEAPAPTSVPATPSAPTPAPEAAEASDRRSLTGILLLLEDSDSAIPDALVVSQNYTRDELTLAYLRGDSRELRWEQPLPDERWSEIQIAADGQTVAVAAGQRLLGLDRADGRQLWAADLSDTLLPECEGCLRVLDRRVVVLTQDGVLSAFEPRGGGVAWSVRLNGTPGQLLLLDGALVLADLADLDSEAALIQVRDPAGGEVLRTIEPACPSGAEGSQRRPALSDRLVAGPDGSVYLALAGADGCAVRVDTASGQVVWATAVESSPEAAPSLVAAGERAYLASGKQLLALDATDGALSTLALERDYLRRPLALAEGTLLVEAIRTRGSRRIELWGLDPATGERRWRHELPTRAALDEDGASWDVRVTPAGMVAVVVDDDRLRIQRIGISDGAARETAVSFGNQRPFWRSVVWGERYAWVIFDHALAVDLLEGRVVYGWPQ